MVNFSWGTRPLSGDEIQKKEKRIRQLDMKILIVYQHYFKNMQE